MNNKNGAIQAVTIHCSATTPKMDWGAREIDLEHRKRGFLKIGYHFVIKRDGTVETGRAESEVGAHVEGHNKGNLGICLIGGLKADGRTPDSNYTGPQMDALKELLKVLTSRYPGVVIKGHRDWPNVNKACPCFDVKSWLTRELPDLQ